MGQILEFSLLYNIAPAGCIYIVQLRNIIEIYQNGHAIRENHRGELKMKNQVNAKFKKEKRESQNVTLEILYERRAEI